MKWIRVLSVLLAAAVLGMIAAPGYGQNEPAPPAAGATLPEGYENVNLQDAELEQILLMVAKKTNKRFLYNPSDLSGKKITLRANRPIRTEALYNIFETIVMQHKMALVPHGKDDPNDPTSAEVVLVVQVRDIPRAASEVFDFSDNIPQRDLLVTVVFPLKFANVNDAARTVAQWITQGIGSVNSINNTNVLIVTDLAINVAGIKRVIELLDVEGPTLKQVIIPIKFSDAEYMATLLRNYFSVATAAGANRNQPNQGAPGGEAQPQVMADRRTNSLIIFASDSQIAQGRELIRQLDIDNVTPSGGLYVVKLKHTNAEEVATTLREIYGIIDTRNQQAGTQAVPNAPRARSDQAPGIVADKQNNSLLIAATKLQFDEIKFVLDQIDVYRPQVLIEAAIVEVSTSDIEKIGLELATADQPHEGAVRFFGATQLGVGSLALDAANNAIKRTPNNPDGLIAGITKDSVTNIPVLLSALASTSNLRVLDRPSLLSVENETAKIKVSDEVPVATLNNSTGQNQVPTTTFDKFVEAEVSMSFTPHIVRGRYVRLEIDPMIIQAFGSKSSASSTLPPPRRSREVTATVTIPNKHTLIMGGYVGDVETEAETKVPYFSDVPLIGRAFRTPDIFTKKSAIFIFITPHILDDPSFQKALDLTDIEKKRMVDLDPTFAEKLETIENYYGQQRLLKFEPRRLELIDYKSPYEAADKR